MKLAKLMALPLLCGAMLQGCDNLSEKTEAEYLAAAKEYYAKDQLPAGIIQLKNALEINPDNAEARRLLGELYLKQGAGDGAEKELRKALVLGVAPEAIREPLAEALKQQGKYQQILTEITPLDSLPPESNARLYCFRGDALQAMGKPDEAWQQYSQALEVDPKSYSAKLGLARLAMDRQKPDEAMALIDEAAGMAPENAEVLAFRGGLYEIKGDLAKAEASYSEAIALNPSQTLSLIHRALVRIDLGKLELAAADVNEAKKQAPQHYLTLFAQGRLALAQDKPQEAETALDESLKLNPGHVMARYFLAEAHLAQQHFEQADSNIRQFLAVSPLSIRGLLIGAIAKLNLKDFEAAKRDLQPLLKHQPDNVGFLRLMASIESARGNTAEAMSLMEKAVKLDPKSAGSQVQLGLGLLAQGKPDQATQSLEKAVELQPDSIKAAVYLFIAEIQAKNYAKARELIAGLEKTLPNDPLRHNLTGMLASAQGDTAAARKAFGSAFKLAPGNRLAGMNLAMLAAGEKEFEEARGYLESILKRHPDDAQAHMALANLAALAGDSQALEADLVKAVESNPRDLGPRVVLARYYNRSGNAAAAERLLEEVRKDYGQNPEWLGTLFEAQSARGASGRAVDTAKALVKAAPESPVAHYDMARAYGETGDIPAMRAALAKSLKLSSDYLPAQLAMVRVQAGDKHWAEAHKALSALKERHPDNTEVLALSGWLALRQGKAEDAVAAYRAVFAKAPSTDAAVTLSSAIWAAGGKDEALKVLTDWVDQNDDDARGHHSLGILYARSGRKAEALQQLERGLELNPKDGALLNDAAVALKAEDPDRALAYAEEAVKLFPESVTYRATLGNLLLDKGDTERALQLFRNLVRQVPGKPLLQMFLARAEATAGNKARAVELLKGLTRPDIPATERGQAEALLKQIEGS